MVRLITAGIAVAAALLSAPAVAQADGELTLFSRGSYSGARRVITGPTQFLEFEMRSVRVPAGQDWELCTGNRFTGCRRFRESVPALVMTVRSARPAMTAIDAAGTTSIGGATIATVAGPSMRGVASEFFVEPQQAGGRIAAAPGSAAQLADEFCRSRGWRSSAHETVQTIAGQAVLADVLCVQSGG